MYLLTVSVTFVPLVLFARLSMLFVQFKLIMIDEQEHIKLWKVWHVELQ